MSTVLLHAIYTHITYMHAHVYIQSTNNQCNSMHQKEFANPSQYHLAAVQQKSQMGSL